MNSPPIAFGIAAAYRRASALISICLVPWARISQAFAAENSALMRRSSRSHSVCLTFDSAIFRHSAEVCKGEPYCFLPCGGGGGVAAVLPNSTIPHVLQMNAVAEVAVRTLPQLMQLGLLVTMRLPLVMGHDTMRVVSVLCRTAH
jgi:hypothetical protein